MCFHGKVVLITGASSGIGAACSLKFAKSSAFLTLVGRNVGNLTKTANQCEQESGLKPLMIIADITTDEDIERIVSETINRYGQIDVLINNAGVSSIEGITKEMDAYDRVMATNARGAYHLTNRVIPHLIKTKGNIVNISSILSMKPLPLMTAYCMSKAAIDMATKCWALQLGSVGVRVNAVNPGPVKTEMFKRCGMTEEVSTQMFAAVEGTAPLKKIPDGENIAELVTFLASNKADCVTGCCYAIDCGISLGNTGKY